MKIAIIALLMICSQSILSQSKTVKGSVKNTSGELLPGVSILIKGTQRGTETDFDGLFTLDNVKPTDQLIFAYLGSETQTIPVGNQSTINVVLADSAEALDEIVVVGYGSQSRASVTGAISTVKSEEISVLPVTNAESALQGRAAGVTILNNGSPGSNPLVLIRGLGTLGNNAPLYVIDGVIVGNLSGISPNDIETVSILKDASTAAIYGARGANGVVIVTTKKGKSGKAKISFNTYSGFQTFTKRYPVMNTVQYLQHAANLGVFPNRPLELYQNNTNWQDEIFQNGYMENYNVSYSAGSQKSQQFFSAEYLSQEGTIINTGFERYSFRANSSVTLGNLKVGESMAVSFGEQKPELQGGGRTLITHAIKSAPYLPVYNPNNVGGFQGPSSSADGQDAENPVRVQTHPQALNKTLSIIGNVYLEYELLEGLKFKSQVGLDYFTFDGKNFTTPYSDDSVLGSSTHAQDFTSYGRSHSQGQTIILTNSLEYNKTFNDVHNLDVLVLSEKNDSKSTNFGGSARNLVSSELEQFGPTNQSIGSGSSETGWLSYLGRINYNYDGKYIVSASHRADASSRFGPNNRWGHFSSGSLGWVISKENFMKDSPFNNLKLRASYGETGNANIGDYAYFATLGGNYEYPIGGGNGPGITQGSPSNPDLQWEEISMMNIGLDFGLFDNKFTGTLEYFQNKSNNLLLFVPTELSSGNPSGGITRNIGELETKGFEVILGYNDYDGDFTWSANFNIGSSINEVQNLGVDKIDGAQMKDNIGFINQVTEGEAAYYFFGLVSDGIYQNQAEVDAVFTANPGQTTVQPGDVRYKDLNGDGTINSEDRTKLADPYPDFTYGLNLTANYKNWDANLFINGVQGVDIYNTNKYDLEAGANRLFNGSTVLLDSWTPSNQSTTQPRVPGAPQNHQISDRYIEDGSFLRFKNISLGYTIDNEKIIGDYLSKLRLYVSTQNLITITNYSGLDPEIGQGNQEFGIDRGRYPQPKSFLLGLQVSF
ncbi:TonB-dependent receptor [uncultured Polaribacter sp.]|uniref:SusC/RagA family TonB-linked outer membrane protein n=1 Tax=uncultured Polaribacter sp. TaxID=174711 RepID=UPI002607701E|nr:TonB-dependent receptor [uncultured Polaribacter sp.]